MKTEAIQLSESITVAEEKTLEILRRNPGMKTVQLGQAYTERSAFYHMDKEGHELNHAWEILVFRKLLAEKKIIPQGGFGNGYIANY